MPEKQLIEPDQTIAFSIFPIGEDDPIHKFTMTGDQLRQVPGYGAAAIGQFRDQMSLEQDDKEICEILLTHTIESGDYQVDEAQATFTAMVAYYAFLCDLDLTQEEVEFSVAPNGEEGWVISPGRESFVEFVLIGEEGGEPICHFSVMSSQIVDAIPVAENEVMMVMGENEEFGQAGKKAACERMLIHLFATGEQNKPENHMITSALSIYLANENKADFSSGLVKFTVARNEKAFAGFDFVLEK